MARPRPTRPRTPSRPRPRPARAPSRALVRTRAELVTPWRDDRQVTRLTHEIHSLTRKAGTLLADHLAAVGARLLRIRTRIGPGQWLEWLAHSVAFERHSAKNYIDLATWAAAEPHEFRRLRTLGPAKLYLIMDLEPRRRRSLVPARLLPLPDGRRKSLETMTYTELGAHLDLGLAIEPAPRQPIAKVLQGYRHEIASLGALTRELAKRRAEIDDATARKLHDEIAAVLAALDDALDL